MSNVRAPMFRNYEMGTKIKGCRNFIKDAELEEEVWLWDKGYAGAHQAVIREGPCKSQAADLTSFSVRSLGLRAGELFPFATNYYLFRFERLEIRERKQPEVQRNDFWLVWYFVWMRMRGEKGWKRVWTRLEFPSAPEIKSREGLQIDQWELSNSGLNPNGRRLSSSRLCLGTFLVSISLFLIFVQLIPLSQILKLRCQYMLLRTVAISEPQRQLKTSNELGPWYSSSWLCRKCSCQITDKPADRFQVSKRKIMQARIIRGSWCY